MVASRKQGVWFSVVVARGGDPVQPKSTLGRSLIEIAVGGGFRGSSGGDPPQALGALRSGKTNFGSVGVAFQSGARWTVWRQLACMRCAGEACPAAMTRRGFWWGGQARAVNKIWRTTRREDGKTRRGAPGPCIPLDGSLGAGASPALPLALGHFVMAQSHGTLGHGILFSFCINGNCRGIASLHA